MGSGCRFYGAAGSTGSPVLRGCRFDEQGQVERAVLLRRLREIGMPLATVGDVLDTDAEHAVHLVAEHVRKALGDAAASQRQAAITTASLAEEPSSEPITLRSPVFAAAVEQGLSATTRESEVPVLNGVLFECGPGSVPVPATDRYRWRLERCCPGSRRWAAGRRRCTRTTCGPRCRARTGAIGSRSLWRARVFQWCWTGRWSSAVGCSPIPSRTTGRCSTRCPPSPPAWRWRRCSPPCVGGEHLRTTVTGGSQWQGTLTTESGKDFPVPARVMGPELDVRFQPTTLYPAVSTAIGADLLLDLRGAEQPATVRSADHADLTTLAMPIPARPRT
ncbi:MerR family transcriptional regulator [Saccharopolyspora gregorii]|uniref:MerR family transcriptional regulator n=2 Tax=Saccharopolyspora gregorii TaxID=33914 RepID=A0ABP6RWM7_9PSEU